MKGLLSIHQKPLHYFYTVALAALIFDGYFLLMKNLPGVGSVPACIVGGSLTLGNILFSVILSILTAIMIAGLIRLYQERSYRKKATINSSLAGFGFIVGFFTVFCALCTIPVISLFGVAIGLGFFTTYNLFFKLISLAVMFFSLYLLNKQLSDSCSCEN